MCVCFLCLLVKVWVEYLEQKIHPAPSLNLKSCLVHVFNESFLYFCTKFLKGN